MWTAHSGTVRLPAHKTGSLNNDALSPAAACQITSKLLFINILPITYSDSIFYKPSSKASKSTVIESIVYDKRTRSAKRGLNANSIFWSILRVSHLNSRFCEHTCAPNSFKVAVGTTIADRPPHGSARALISACGSYRG